MPRLAALALAPLALSLAPAPAGGGHAAGLEVIRAADLEEHIEVLAAPALEGRDSPSPGLRAAAEHVASAFAALGLEPCADSLEVLREHERRAGGAEDPGDGSSAGDTTAARAGTFLRPFVTNPVLAPVPSGCALELVGGEETFAFEEDFVPVGDLAGSAEGPLVFAGFGIRERSERYDDLDRIDLDGAIALVFEGEPNHSRRFEGEEVVTEAASLWRKVELLAEEGAAGVLVVRRPQVDREDHELAFRYGHAVFVDEGPPRPPQRRPPALELDYDAATRLLGRDARDLARRMDRTAKPVRVDLKDRVVRMRAETSLADVRVDNVVGVLPGSDPELADEYVVIGAHYDHIGVDLRGRIGPGADDNASGTAALLEVAQALVEAGPRRSILFCAFGAEEDGLVGSSRFTQRLPVERDQLVAMLNMDMVGRGDARELTVLGCQQNPALADVLREAERLGRTGVSDVDTTRGRELWNRSDHFSFHKIRVPTLFFFEGAPISRNRDYHTWRDRIDGVDPEKVENTAKLVFNTAWILANDDDRPPPPRD